MTLTKIYIFYSHVNYSVTKMAYDKETAKKPFTVT